MKISAAAVSALAAAILSAYGPQVLAGEHEYEHEYISSTISDNNIAYIQENKKDAKGNVYQDGDSVKLQNYAIRFRPDLWSSGLFLDEISVTGNPTENGSHNSWIGIFGSPEEGAINQQMSIKTVNLGKNTSFQVHGEVPEGTVHINVLNVTSEVPDGVDPSDYNDEINMAQIEAWGGTWNYYIGQSGASLTIDQVNVEDGQSVALSVRNTDHASDEDWASGTSIQIEKAVLGEDSGIRSGYSISGSNPTGRAWAHASIGLLSAEGDSYVTIDNGTLSLEQIAISDGKELSITTNTGNIKSTEGKNSEPILAGNSDSVLDVTLGKGSSLKFNAKTAEGSSMTIATQASDPGKVDLGTNAASLTGEYFTVRGSSEGSTGDSMKDLLRLSTVVQRDGEQVEDVKLEQAATDLYDAAEGYSTADGVRDATVHLNSHVYGIAEMAALGLHVWRNEINDMNKRLGELRDSKADSNGLWARVYNGKAKIGSLGVTNKYTAVQMGYDRQISSGVWLGGAFSYTYGDNDFRAGSGDSSLMAFTGYGSWLADNGFFLDVTGKVGRMKNTFDIAAASGMSSANYHTNAVSVSAEAGWRFPITDMFYVEPQAEMMWGHVSGVSYDTSVNVNVDQSSVDTLIGRAGFALGIKCPNDRGNAYIRASVLHDWEGETEYAFHQNGKGRSLKEDLGGTWYEYGLGANINLTKQTHFYADLEAASGGEVDTDYRVNIGVRYSY